MGMQGPDGKIDPNAPINFQPPHIRSDFIKKVYTILSFQLLLTTIIGYYIMTQSQSWIKQHAYVSQIASMVTLAAVIGVSCCCSEVARHFPTNYLFLGVVTVGIGISTGFVASLYTAESVVLALLATSAVFFALTAFACLTGSDFTGMGPYLMAALMSLMAFSIVMMLYSMVTGNPVDHGIKTLYSCAGVVIFSLFIVYDTQLIVGGEHKKHEFGIDDYVFAALNIYLDVINLFMMLLSLMGDRR